jgi:hypothetical protein
MGINEESLHSGSETWEFANNDTKRNIPIVDNFLKCIGGNFRFDAWRKLNMNTKAIHIVLTIKLFAGFLYAILGLFNIF